MNDAATATETMVRLLEPSAPSVSHADLVIRAGRWLRNTIRCKTVLFEPGYGYPSEVPDAIGWTNRHSVLVECKVTRRDFLADRRKTGRRRELNDGGLRGGLGEERWYLTPSNLVRPDEVPDGWGLLELRGDRVYRTVPATRRRPHPDYLLRERHILASCLSVVQGREEGLALLPTRHQERNLGVTPGPALGGASGNIS